MTMRYLACPVCGGRTLLRVFPEPDAGIWECLQCGASDTCPHVEQHSELVEADTTDSHGEHKTYTDSIMVCDVCGLTVGPAESEPDYE